MIKKANPKTASVNIVRREPATLTVADRDLIERFITRLSNYKRKKLDEVLDASAYVWLCYSEGRLVGTTAVRRLAARVQGREVTVIYTAVVGVDPAYRRLGLIARMGLRSYLIERVRAPFRPVYWLALAGSPAGYLQMARNIDTFWPRPGAEMPAEAREVLGQALAALGSMPTKEVEGCTILLDDFGVLDTRQDPERWDRAAPDVDLFLRVNPEYRRGHDLACLCPLDFVTLGRSFLRRTVIRPRRAPRPAAAPDLAAADVAEG